MKKAKPVPPPVILFPPMPAVETVLMPLAWFTQLLMSLIYACVRPPTAKTRRKEHLIKLKMPIEAFDRLLEPFKDREVVGLSRATLGCGDVRLYPTKVTRKNLIYDYKMIKGSFLDRLLQLEGHDDVRAKSKKDVRWRRGMGAARLWLSHAAGQRGEESLLLALVCGEVKLKLTQPREWVSMPILEVRLKVLTMDEFNNIILPCEFQDEAYKKVLRHQARTLLQKMINDPLYPTGSQMAALTMGTTTVRVPPDAVALLHGPPGDTE